MDREKAKQILTDGGNLSYHAWSFYEHGMHCWSYDDEYGYCCEDYYSNVEEALNAIESYSGGRWEEVYE